MTEIGPGIEPPKPNRPVVDVTLDKESGIAKVVLGAVTAVVGPVGAKVIDNHRVASNREFADEVHELHTVNNLNPLSGTQLDDIETQAVAHQNFINNAHLAGEAVSGIGGALVGSALVVEGVAIGVKKAARKVKKMITR